MNIVVISQYFYPDNFRINEIVEDLVERGNNVKVITGLPDYSTSKIPKEFKFFKKRNETINGATVIRVPIIARRSGIIFRALNYLSFVISGLLHTLFCNKKNVDAIYIYQTSPVLQAIPALLLKKRTKAKLTLYCCDLWPESLKAWNITENSLLFKATKKLSKAIYCSCDMVTITSKPFKDYLISVCDVNENKIKYHPQHAEDLYQHIKSKYVDNGCVDFMFAGNIGSVQNVDCIIKSIKQVKTDKNYHVHIVGDGSELNSCKQLANDLDVEDKITFHGRYPLEEMERFYLLADCLLLTLRGGDFIGMTLPAKSQGYLSCGKPLVGAIDGAGEDMIIEADCGLCGSAGDYNALAKNITEVIENFENLKIKGCNGRNFYEKNFSKKVFMDDLVNTL